MPRNFRPAGGRQGREQPPAYRSTAKVTKNYRARHRPRRSAVRAVPSQPLQVQNDSESDGDGPIELPNGRLMCRAHGLVVCGYCCVDYSFMDEILEDSSAEIESSDDERNQAIIQSHHAQQRSKPATCVIGTVVLMPESVRAVPPRPQLSIIAGSFMLGRPTTRGTGQAFGTEFEPPSPTSTVSEVFEAVTRPNCHRYIRRDDPTQALIYADGACLNNGQTNPQAGWAFVYSPATAHHRGVVAGRLEREGPFGDANPQTSNRAELRAILAALRFRHWKGEGYTSLVVATDSEYVALGATSWARRWIRNGWTTRQGAVPKNRDLWEAVLGEIERAASGGLAIQFWRIPRAWNEVADAAAKQAAAEEEVNETFFDFCGIIKPE